MMSALAVVTPYSPLPSFRQWLAALVGHDIVEAVMVVSPGAIQPELPRCRVIVGGPIASGVTLGKVLTEVEAKYVLLIPGPRQVSLAPGSLGRLLDTADSTGAGLVYSDLYERDRHGKTLYPLNDYQSGSVRDDFDFGAMMLFSVHAIRKALERHGPIPTVRSAGLYDLRLKVSIDHSVHHLCEPLYEVIATGNPAGDDTLFSYVDPRNVDVQKEMEAVFTAYLKQIDAYLSPSSLRETARTQGSFPVEASVVIPVRNRKGTIAEAVKSGLSQETDFPFNVIVVDNHSTDGTTTVLSELAGEHAAVHHIVPERTDLAIGGCWNQALHAAACGRFAVQLDSDDLYGTANTLQTIVSLLRRDRYAMVIGSYTIVDFDLNEIPPGLIDHKEWTDENGHNNALRINGLGAPRAFDTTLMRAVGFPNVSYGEDYTAALRISREYRIGRIYESLYLCRRWPGNTDADLSIQESNRNDVFKDRIRTQEILARQKMNRGDAEQTAPRAPG